MVLCTHALSPFPPPLLDPISRILIRLFFADNLACLSRVSHAKPQRMESKLSFNVLVDEEPEAFLLCVCVTTAAP